MVVLRVANLMGKERLNEVMHGRYVAKLYDSPFELREGQRRSLRTSFPIAMEVKDICWN